MRKTFCLLAVLGFALSLTVPAFADKPKVSCTLLNCCRQTCPGACIDSQGNYQSCQTYVGACDGACDLQRVDLGQTMTEPIPTEEPALELFPLQQDAPAPLFTPATAAGCPAAA